MKVYPRTDDTSFLLFWNNPRERSIFNFEPHGDGFIIRHQWHGWSRNQRKDFKEFEGNSWIAINRDTAFDERDKDSTYLHLTKNKNDAIVVHATGYRDTRLRDVDLYYTWIRREQKK